MTHQYDTNNATAPSPDIPDPVRQAWMAIDNYRRLLAGRGIAAQSCLAEVRRTQGEAAVARLLREAEVNVRGIKERIERDAMHAPASNTPTSRHMLRHGGRI